MKGLRKTLLAVNKETHSKQKTSSPFSNLQRLLRVNIWYYVIDYEVILGCKTQFM